MIGFQPFETFQLLAQSSDGDRANTLLIASCDAFARRKKPDMGEIEQFEVLASRLFQIASVSTRNKAALLLKSAQNLTPNLEKIIIENVGADLPDYLASNPHISEQSLQKLINEKNIDINAIIAQRADLPTSIITSLFKTNSRKTYRALAANMSISLNEPYLNAFVRSAQMDHQVAHSLAMRSDFDKALLAPVFFDLFEADAVVTRIGIRFFSDQFRRKDLILHHLADFTDRVVLVIGADVECLVADNRQRCFQGFENAQCRVIDMNERSPLIAAVHGDHPLRLSFGGEHVDHEIKPGPSRQAIDGGKPY